MAVGGFESLAGLQTLHRDLINLTESRLPNIERLLSELEARVEDFRALLDKKSKNDQSRQQLAGGTVKVEEDEYTINDEFRQETIQLADALDLDELDAAKLYIQAQEDARALDRSPLASSIILFHQRRQYVLDCLRLALQAASNPDDDDDAARPFKMFVDLVLQAQEGQAQAEGSKYWRRCFQGMEDVERILQQVAERVQSMAITGQVATAEFTEIMDFQRTSLLKQHEALGAVLYQLIKANYTRVDDFKMLITRLRSVERYDALVTHYLPALAASITQFAASENSCSLQESRSLHETIVLAKDNEAWSLRSLQAAAKTCWLAEYSGRFIDSRGLPPGADDEKEADERSNAFMEALKDGAFQFQLCLCRDVKTDVWIDPLRSGFTAFLTRDTPALQADPFTVSPFMQEMLMRQIQLFVEAYISNMPDTLRMLKSEEDEQRRRMQGLMQLRPDEFELHLERFLLLIAYAYEGSSDAAEAFWMDPDGNLFGFLQWASQRQSTPRVAAFCLMLKALSEGESCSDSAHKFMLGDASTTPARLRRSSPLGWHHVLSELEFYSSTIREAPALQQSKSHGEVVEPESAMMLECYLRLLSHLCKESPMARTWFLTHNTFHVHEHLLLLCGSSIESRLRACAFAALAALLTEKDREVGDNLWSALDAWISGGALSSLLGPRAPANQAPPAMNEQIIFESISTGFEEPNAFMELLQALIFPVQNDQNLNDGLPFPEALGSAYRMPGIDPYVDFVLGRVLATKSLETVDLQQLRILRFHCLRFAATCLASFNDSLVAFAHHSHVSVDSAIQTSTLATYARIHPFARVMEWFFNERVIAALFDTARQDLKEVNEAEADSPLILGLVQSIRMIDLVMAMQSTYFDIVRPIVKLQSASRRATVADSSLASFEDAVLNNVDIVTSLGLYCGTAHQDLADVSLQLLQRFSSSRKLTAPPPAGRRLTDKSRLITALERNNEVESISRSLVAELTLDESELEQGPAAPGLNIKQRLLSFLNTCLESVADRPTIAHLLLGFACQPHGIDISHEGLFPSNSSLFHAILRLVIDCPFGDSVSFLSWLTAIKSQGLQLLQKLWRSQMSAYLVIPELRDGELLFAMWLHQPVVDLDTLWDGRPFHEGDFFLTDSTLACTQFFELRTSFLDYVSTELRAVSESSMATLQERIQKTLLGIARLPDGREVQCPTVFDFTDFLRFEMLEGIIMPESRFYNFADFELCRDDSKLPAIYNLHLVEQLLMLRENELRKTNQLESPADEQQLHADAQNLLQCMHANNGRLTLQVAHLGTLHSWCQLIIVFLSTCKLETAHRESFILQALQVVLARLERSYAEDMETSLLLAQLGRALLQHSELSSAQGDEGADSSRDRYSQLFRAALIGIQHPDAAVPLREVCSLISYDYLRRIVISKSTRIGSARSHALQSVRAIGDRLIEVLCDDAYSGEGTCRIASLLLLDSIIGASGEKDAKEVLDGLGRFNFVQVVVDNIRNIPQEVQESEDNSMLLEHITM
jgi:nuclear pore complex protein Nup205